MGNAVAKHKLSLKTKGGSRSSKTAVDRRKRRSPAVDQLDQAEETLSEVLSRLADECDDPLIASWLKGLAEGQGAKGTVKSQRCSPSKGGPE